MLPKNDGKGFQQILRNRINSIPYHFNIDLIIVKPIHEFFRFNRQSEYKEKLQGRYLYTKFMYPTVFDFLLLPFYLFSGMPLQVIIYRNARLKKFIKERVDRLENDNCYVMTSRVFFADLEKFNNLLVDFVDSMHLNFSRRAMSSKNFFKKLLFFYEANRMYFWDASVSKKSSMALTVSLLDQSIINKNRCEVIPIGIDDEREIELGKNPKHLVFSGDLGYSPNIEAISYFSNKCWPAIRRKFPSMEFHIIGRNLTKKNKCRFEKIEGVIIVGEVQNMVSNLQRYKYSVAPMVSGSGMQFKIIEAMFAGPVVLATHLAIGALKMENKKHLFIVETGKDFLHKIIELEGNQKLVKKIKANAFKAVVTEYSWRKVNKLFCQTKWFRNL